MRILLAEDNPDQLEPMQTALEREHHIVDPAEDGTIAAEMLVAHTYDLLILDWMLPGMSGLDLCRQYRQSGGKAPVLILTARGSLKDRVTGLDSGADDYLVKPVSLLELLARVRALGRRLPQWQGDVVTLADVSLYVSSLELERSGKRVKLSKREFQLLDYLLRHPHQVLTHTQLEQALWALGTEPESNALSKLVRRLRLRLETLGIDTWIETVYGMGYRLSVPELCG
ncbi:response regulator transcription factor [Nodosilinea sp. E11]|uniref:response regulator transcription factor n=1 Tax=Nodosilinea sp. E11 TaxID=3037479 RepID=UPI002934FC77|nr:response regulator transcription factor [Nodosilinea sp. E11]WOD40296.1 response regulator transcription factor [Nodosilinea sp. E11]